LGSTRREDPRCDPRDWPAAEPSDSADASDAIEPTARGSDRCDALGGGWKRGPVGTDNEWSPMAIAGLCDWYEK